jgi:hypothetical protein
VRLGVADVQMHVTHADSRGVRGGELACRGYRQSRSQ